MFIGFVSSSTKPFVRLVSIFLLSMTSFAHDFTYSCDEVTANFIADINSRYHSYTIDQYVYGEDVGVYKGSFVTCKGDSELLQSHTRCRPKSSSLMSFSLKFEDTVPLLYSDGSNYSSIRLLKECGLVFAVKEL